MIYNTLRHVTTIALAGVFAVGLSAGAMAATGWEQSHPRRDQVNDRLHNQNARINQERREGEIGYRRAAQLHRDDHQIRNEERIMARQDGGHITRLEQRTLNQQENHVSRQIGR
jgi:hypothetical protein